MMGYSADDGKLTTSQRNQERTTQTQVTRPPDIRNENNF